MVGKFFVGKNYAKHLFRKKRNLSTQFEKNILKKIR